VAGVLSTLDPSLSFGGKSQETNGQNSQPSVHRLEQLPEHPQQSKLGINPLQNEGDAHHVVRYGQSRSTLKK